MALRQSDRGSRFCPNFSSPAPRLNPHSARRTAAPEGNLSQRSLLGMDSESQQAGAVRLRAQLSDRHRQRGHCRCGSHTGQDL
jgi:hypothetical protein